MQPNPTANQGPTPFPLEDVAWKAPAALTRVARMLPPADAVSLIATSTSMRRAIDRTRIPTYRSFEATFGELERIIEIVEPVARNAAFDALRPRVRLGTKTRDLLEILPPILDDPYGFMTQSGALNTFLPNRWDALASRAHLAHLQVWIELYQHRNVAEMARLFPGTHVNATQNHLVMEFVFISRAMYWANAQGGIHKALVWALVRLKCREFLDSDPVEQPLHIADECIPFLCEEDVDGFHADLLRLLNRVVIEENDPRFASLTGMQTVLEYAHAYPAIIRRAVQLTRERLLKRNLDAQDLDVLFDPGERNESLVDHLSVRKALWSRHLRKRSVQTAMLLSLNNDPQLRTQVNDFIRNKGR